MFIRFITSFLLFTGYIFFNSLGFSQVTIGSDKSPHTGAALELISNDDKGLLLPKVELTSATVWSPISGAQVDGMLVYNTNDTSENGLEGLGIYVWFDDKWNILEGGESEVIIETPGEVDYDNAIIYGPVCYDVAQSNFSENCGAQTSRIPAFPADAPLKRNRGYSVVFADNVDMSSVTDFEVGVNYDFRGIIKAVSGKVASNISRNQPFGVVFADDINSIALGTSPYGGTEISVTLWASYKINGVKMYTTLEITVQDCACCPKEGYLVPNGVYTSIDGNDYTTSPIAQYTQVAGSALCVFPLDGHFGQDWDTARAGCADGKFVPGQGPYEGWRLPNVGEIKNLLELDTYAEHGLTATDGTSYRYWSITEYGTSPGGTQAYYAFRSRNSKTASPMNLPKGSSVQIGTRCVKTVGE